jgi:hypothetical protein
LFYGEIFIKEAKRGEESEGGRHTISYHGFYRHSGIVFLIRALAKEGTRRKYQELNEMVIGFVA